MTEGIKSLARQLQKKGRKGDTILAHINPREAEILRALGGSGTRNPHTGLLEFEDDSGGASGGGSGASDSNDAGNNGGNTGGPGDSNSGSNGNDGPGPGNDSGMDGALRGGGGGANYDEIRAMIDDLRRGRAAPGAPNPRAVEDRQESLDTARNIAARNPMQHIAGGMTGQPGYQGPLNSFRPNYFAYGPSPSMQFGANYQAPGQTGGMEAALSRGYQGPAVPPVQGPAVQAVSATMAASPMETISVVAPTPMRDTSPEADQPPVVAIAPPSLSVRDAFLQLINQGPSQFAQGGLAQLQPYQHYARRLQGR